MSTLKFFTKETLPVGGRSQEPYLMFNKSGIITFSKTAAEIIGLNNEDSVAIVQDEVHKQNWYITKHPDGYSLRISKGKYQCLTFNHSKITAEVLKLTAPGVKSIKMSLANHPESREEFQLWGLIHKS